MDIFKVIAPLVVMPRYMINYDKRYKRVVLNYIDYLKNTLYKNYDNSNKINELVIGHLVLLLDDVDALSKYDKNKGSFGSFIRMKLYYTILDEYKKITPVDLVDYVESVDTFTTTTVSGANTVESVVYEKEFIKVIRDYYGPEIFDMRVAGLRNMDIAKKIGKTSEQLKYYFYGKKKGLVKHLENYGYTIEDLPKSIINKL
jgi:hypothetical protein